MRFKLLVGRHTDKDKNGKEVSYKAPAEFDSEVDLVEKFNSPGSTKFERVYGREDWEREQAQKENERLGANPQPPASTPAAVPNPQNPPNLPKETAKEVGKDAVVNKPKDVDLNRLNEQQLRALAADEEIDLKGARTKDQMLKVIKQHYE